jgi:Tol biopolymer transport system component
MNLAWTPEGKLLAVESESMKTMRDRKFTTWLIDVPTREKTKLEVPETAQIFAATPDGKSWIASTYDFAEKRLCHVSISRKDNSVSQFTQVGFGSMSPEQFIRLRLSPDGLRFLFLDIDRGEKLAAGMARFPRLYIFDLKTQKRERIADIPLDAFVWEYTWSPDSKKVAYIWKRMEPGVPLAASLDKNGKVKEDPKRDTETETHLNVADATGKNSRTILSAKGQSGPAITMSRLEWR